MNPDAAKNTQPVIIVALAGWILPGAGYFLIQERTRALLICLTVLLTFFLGILIGGIHVVDAPTEFTTDGLLAKPWFMGQVLAGPLSIVAAHVAGGVDPLRVATSRSWELGTLYTAIAGMLNLLAVIDSAYRRAIGDFGDVDPSGEEVTPA